MNRLVLVLALAFAIATPAGVFAASDPMKTVQQFVDGFNKGDLKMAAATCAEEMSIIDEFPPYL